MWRKRLLDRFAFFVLGAWGTHLHYGRPPLQTTLAFLVAWLVVYLALRGREND